MTNFSIAIIHPSVNRLSTTSKKLLTGLDKQNTGNFLITEGANSQEEYALKASELITKYGITNVYGGWTSEQFYESCFVLLENIVSEDNQDSSQFYKKLSDVEHQFETIFDNSPIAKAYLDEEGNVLSINKQFVKLYGYTKKDIKNMSEWWPKAYPDEEYRAEVIKTWENEVRLALSANKIIQPQEYTVTCKDNRQVYVLIEGVIVENGLLTTHSDITEQKIAQMSLKESELSYKIQTQRLSTLIDSQPSGIVISSSSRVIKRVNQQFCDIFGFKESPEELIGVSGQEAIFRVKNSLINVENFAKEIETLINHKHEILNYQFQLKNGRILERDYVPVPISENNEVEHMWLYRDVTDKVRNQQLVTQSESISQAILENTRDVFLSIDRDYRVMIINSSGIENYKQYFNGLEIKVGDKLLESIPKSIRKEWKNRYDRGFSGERFSELLDYSKAGDPRFIELTINPIKQDGVITSVSIVTRNITEKVVAKNQLSFHEKSIKEIIRNTSRKTGQDYFNQIVITLNQIVKADYTFIGLLKENHSIDTISLCSEGKILNNFNYELEGTPCKNVIAKETCIYPENITDLFPKDQLLIDMGITGYVGTPIFSKKGEACGIVVSLYKTPLKDSDFVSSLFELFVANIAGELDRVEAENALTESENKLRKVFNSYLDVYYEVDNNGCFEVISPSAETIFGYKPSEMIGKKSTRIYENPEDRSRLEFLLRQTGKASGLLTNAKKKTGEIIVVESDSKNKINEFGEVIGSYGVLRDVTDRIKTQERLAETQRAANIAGWDWDILGDLFWWSDEYFKILGENPNSFEPNIYSLLFYVHPDDIERVTKELKQSIGKGINLKSRFKIVTKEKVVRTVWLKAYVTKNDKGESSRVYGTLQDISSLAKIESELEQKEILLKEIHHRVKNNLQIVSSLLSLQSTQFKDQEIKESFKGSQNRIATMALVHEQLYKSNELSNIGSTEYIKTLANNLNNSIINDKEIELITHVEDTTLDIDTATPMGLIINELISNSLKHAFVDCEISQPKIEIIFTVEDNQVTLVVKDNGKGMIKSDSAQKSLGLKLITTLSRQLSADLMFNNEEQGVKATLIFKV